MHALDSNIVVAAMNGDPLVGLRLSALAPADVIIPSVVLAELFYGARRSAKRDSNHARLRSLAARFTIATLGEAEAEHIGTIKASLAAAGRMKADMDLLIAATALARGAVLVTDDRSLHDVAIPGLVVENWLTDPTR